MEGIKEALEDVKIAVNESASGITNVTENTVSLSNDISDIGKEADFNMEIVGKLNNEVGKFKL